jgi:hypothetical protein
MVVSVCLTYSSYIDIAYQGPCVSNAVSAYSGPVCVGIVGLEWEREIGPKLGFGSGNGSRHPT